VLLSLVAGLAASTTLLIRESAARHKADKAAVRAQQSASFLASMLQSVGPSIALGRDTTLLREVLDATADRVHGELGKWPELEAELRTVLGNTYEDLAEYERALEMHRAALQLRIESLAAKSPLIAESLFNIAYVLDFTDGLVEAEKLLREAIDIEAGTQPQRIARLAEARDLLAWVLLRQGKLAEAEQVARQMLDSFQPTDIEMQRIHTRSLDTLGSILLKSAQFAESEKVHRECLQATIDLEGSFHPRVVTSINNLCHALVRTGKFDEVEKIANEALALQEKVLGKPIGSCTDSLQKALAQVCESRHDYAGAIAHLETAVDAASQMFGPDHGFCNDKRALLARMQIADGRLEDAQRTIEAARANGGTDSAENSLNIAASQLALARGDAKKAEDLACRELERIRQNSNTPTLQTVDALQSLAAAQLAMGDQQQAESTLHEAIRILRPEMNVGMPMLVSLENDLKKVFESKDADK
jgi:tetratricopeptide (TPR) repeat protein